MQSAKVSIGDTATASQYNNSRADALQAGYYPIEEVDGDDTDVITEVIIGDLKAAGFAGSGDSSCYFDVQIPEQIDTGEDWEIKIGFDMSTAEASKAVRLSLDYAAIADAGDTTPTATTVAETVTTPDTAETLKVVTLSTIKIPQADLAGGKTVTFKLTRLADNAADTHGGVFRLNELHLFQNQS